MVCGGLPRCNTRFKPRWCFRLYVWLNPFAGVPIESYGLQVDPTHPQVWSLDVAAENTAGSSQQPWGAGKLQKTFHLSESHGKQRRFRYRWHHSLLQTKQPWNHLFSTATGLRTEIQWSLIRHKKTHGVGICRRTDWLGTSFSCHHRAESHYLGQTLKRPKLTWFLANFLFVPVLSTATVLMSINWTRFPLHRHVFLILLFLVTVCT